MQFLLDVCADSRLLRTALTSQGHDVLTPAYCGPRSHRKAMPILERSPRESDEVILALATEEQRTIITEDKDFGELIFLRRLPYPCVIRFVAMPVAEKVKAVLELIENNAHAIESGYFITVTKSRVRIRP